jgi:prepilin-type N-terminal cleavage/methylation domain-containing protein
VAISLPLLAATHPAASFPAVSFPARPRPARAIPHPAPTRGAPAAGASGFSLVEVTVALLVLSLALLLGMTLLGIQQRAVLAEPLQLGAHRAVEATLESLRAGGVELASGPVRFHAAPPALDPRLTLWMEITPSGRPHLYAVRVAARWSSPFGVQEYAVSSLTYQPLPPGASPAGASTPPDAAPGHPPEGTR